MANQITVDIVADTRQLVAGVKNTNTQLNSLNGSISKLKSGFGGLASIFGAQISINWFKQIIKDGYDEQASFAALQDLYGAEFDKIVDKVNAISSKFYVDDGDIAQYFVQLKSAFTSRLDKFVPEVVEASNIIALLKNVPVSQVIDSWTVALKDGKLTAKEVQKIGIDLTKEQEEAFNKLNTTAEQMAFLLDIVNGKQKEALDNITGWQKITYYTGQFKDKIADALIPIIEKLVGWYEKLTPGQQKIIDGIAAFVVIVGGLLAVIGPVLLGLGMVWKIFKDLEVAARLLTIAQGLLNLVYSPYLVVILAIIAAGVLLYKNWDSVKEMAGKLWDKIKQVWEWLKTNWPTVLAILTGPIGLAVKYIIDNWDKIKEGIKKAIDGIKNLFSGWVNDFKNFGRNLINGLVDGIKALAQAPLNAVKGIADGVKNIWRTITGTKSPSKVFKGYGENLVEGLALGIQGAQRLADQAMVDLNSNLVLSPSYGNSRGNGVNITINAGLGTDPYELGRVVKAAMDKYTGVNGR